MPPQFFESGQPVRHPLELKFNASAWDILCAIERGFRAQVDVKGKLAEWFLYKVLEIDREAGLLQAVEWSDEDSKPDFRLIGTGFDLTMERKNLRSEERYADGSYKLETQKTRNQKDAGGAPEEKGTLWYKVTEFDLVAACLFNQTGKWEYVFARTADFGEAPQGPQVLEDHAEGAAAPRWVLEANIAGGSRPTDRAVP
jgi:hypothetical protein